jgi:hypothetical protein
MSIVQQTIVVYYQVNNKNEAGESLSMTVRTFVLDFSLCGSSIFLEPVVFLSRRSGLNINDGQTHFRLQLRVHS